MGALVGSFLRKNGMKPDLTSLLQGLQPMWQPCRRLSPEIAVMTPLLPSRLALVHGFALSRAQAWPIMLEFNARCDPPWSEKELAHKLDDAAKLARHSKPRGHLLGERGPVSAAASQAAGRYGFRR